MNRKAGFFMTFVNVGLAVEVSTLLIKAAAVREGESRGHPLASLCQGRY